MSTGTHHPEMANGSRRQIVVGEQIVHVLLHLTVEQGRHTAVPAP
ncbi:hypothetical protein [Streptomyces sp. NPDC048603]